MKWNEESEEESNENVILINEQYIMKVVWRKKIMCNERSLFM